MNSTIFFFNLYKDEAKEVSHNFTLKGKEKITVRMYGVFLLKIDSDYFSILKIFFLILL